MSFSESIRIRMKRLRLISWAEGSTLLLLVLIAVPLKYLAGMAQAVSIMGPIHGVAFLLYLAMVFRVVAMGGWRAGDIARMILAAFLPFGAFVNAPFMRDKERELIARHQKA